MPALRIKKKYLQGLAIWLNNQSLQGVRSRMRTRFVKDLLQAIKELESERMYLVKLHAKTKKEKGKEVLETEERDGAKHYVFKDIKAFEEDVLSLYNEDFVMSLSPENKEKLEMISDIILTTDEKFGPDRDDSPEERKRKTIEAEHYDEWCKAFEDLCLSTGK